MNSGEKIKMARVNAGYTQKKLAELSGVAEITIRQYETGKREPRISQLQKIALALDKPVEYLISTEPTSVFDVSKISAAVSKAMTAQQEKELEKENMLILSYRKLNSLGKEEANKRISELTEIKKYTETNKKKLTAIFKPSNATKDSN